MSFRSISPQSMFARLAMEHTPLHRFKGRNRVEFSRWKKRALPAVMATLGDFPGRVPLNPMRIAEWEHDGLVKERWLIDVGRHISATFQVNRPGKLKRSERRPALLCWHGHGTHGKDPVMGNVGVPPNPGVREAMQGLHYDYGHQMAKAGFVTYAIDWIGCGDRDDSKRPNSHNQGDGRDWCNLYYLHATMLGMTSISINVTHGMAATDFACTLPFVDSRRLGVMGLSGGGTMTIWTALCDPRFKAAEIICFSDLWAHFGIRDINYCGMQVAPGLFKLVDLPDLQGLIAPKPLLVDIGALDTCFRIDTAMACYRQVERIYKIAGHSGNLELDLFTGDHGWGGNKSVAFFGKHL